MLIELGTMVLTAMLAVTGLSVPQLNLEAANATMNGATATACSTQTADSCLDLDTCDVFLASSGAEMCAVACDMRDLNTCQSDSGCMIVNGACDYADHSPVGC